MTRIPLLAVAVSLAFVGLMVPATGAAAQPTGEPQPTIQDRPADEAAPEPPVEEQDVQPDTPPADTPPAQGDPADQPATPQDAEDTGLTVRELVVLHVDQFTELANDPAVVRSSLFVPVPRTGRQRADEEDRMEANQPMPLGLITFEGAIDQPTRVRIDVQGEDAFLHAHWPESAEKGPASIDWFNIVEADNDLGSRGMDGGTHWLSPLRQSEDRLWLNVRGAWDRERFMLYDPSLTYRSTLGLEFENDRYVVTAATETPQQDWTTPPLTLLVQRHGDQWQSAAIAAPWPTERVPLLSLQDSQAQQPDAMAALAPLAEMLYDRGYNANEVQAATGMVRMAGLERSTVSLVYVLPEGEIDRHIWLRLRPEPDRVIRTGIVVVTNIDPNLSAQIELLVQNLGHPEWAVRDRSQRELINLGEAAIETVERMRNSPDPEITFRAMQILDAHRLRTEDAGQP